MPRSTVMIELASDASLARDLAAGGVFVPGCTLPIAEECELVVCGARGRVSVPARVVYVDDHRGAGLELIGFSTEMREQLAGLEPAGPSPAPVLADSGAPDDPGQPAAQPAAQPADEDDLAVPVASETDDDDRTIPVSTGVHEALEIDRGPPADAEAPGDAAPDDLAVPVALDPDDDPLTLPIAMGIHPSVDAEPAPATDLAEADAAFFDAAYQESALGPGGAGDPGDGSLDDPAVEPATDPDLAAELAEADDAGDHRGEMRAPRNVHERLRGLPLAAQLKLATSGELHERIVLERLYGKNVWETLLRNPRLTPPEVSRIARYGSLPRILLEIILANNAWLAVPEVRRALLSNPRLGTDQIMKVLRLVPKHELRLAAIQTAYPQAVRGAARTLLDE